MKAAQIVNFREPLQIAQLPDPVVVPNGALVRVEASGICRTDWHFWNGDWTWMGMHLPLPTVLGHEVGGVIVEVGREVETVKVGDRVTIPFHESDGTCPQCRAGHENLCDHFVNPAVDRPGGWAELVSITHADLNCIPLPDEVDTLSAAALGCRYMTAYHAVTARGQVQAGQWVAVYGCGGVGLSAVQIAAAQGAMVVAVDIDGKKLAKAQAEGAVAVINAGQQGNKVAQAVKDATDGGAHVSIDALGRAFTTQPAIQSLRKRGRHVQVGLTSQEEAGMTPIPIDLLVNNEWEIVGSVGNPHPNYAQLLALVANGTLNPRSLVSQEVTLSDISGVLQAMNTYDTLGFHVVTSF